MPSRRQRTAPRAPLAPKAAGAAVVLAACAPAFFGTIPAAAWVPSAASAGALALVFRRAWARAVLLVLGLAPGAWLSFRELRSLSRPDTRELAAAWLRTNVPPGDTVVLDAPDASPPPDPSWKTYRLRGSPFLDVRPGLDTARAVRAGWVVTSSHGTDPRKNRELASFFAELEAEADFVHEQPFEPGGPAGPWLRVWRLRR